MSINKMIMTKKFYKENSSTSVLTNILLVVPTLIKVIFYRIEDFGPPFTRLFIFLSLIAGLMVVATLLYPYAKLGIRDLFFKLIDERKIKSSSGYLTAEKVGLILLWRVVFNFLMLPLAIPVGLPVAIFNLIHYIKKKRKC